MGTLRLCCSLLCACCLAAAASEPPSGNGDTGAIRDIVARYVQARNTKDIDSTRSLFTPDADQLVSTGEWRRGLDSLVRGAMASSQKETGRSSIAVESIRFVDPGAAIVDGRYQTTSADGTVRNMWTTLILKRGESGWRITAIRNMLPAFATSR